MPENTPFSQKYLLNVAGNVFDVSKPKVMGVLNITPNSFFEGSRLYGNIDKALATAQQMIENGADILDIGGYSTRNPNIYHDIEETSSIEESDRVLPVITAIKKQFPSVIISIDTFRAGVARQAVEAGANIINDISGGTFDPEMFDTVATLQVPYILMHLRGTLATMNQLCEYQHTTLDVLGELQAKVYALRQHHVHDIIIDPGFGFAKTIDQNYQMLQELEFFKALGCPILVGFSRKSMIWKTLDTSPKDALNGTTILNTIALMNGANILRVHDVKEAKEAVLLTEKVKNRSFKQF